MSQTSTAQLQRLPTPPGSPVRTSSHHANQSPNCSPSPPGLCPPQRANPSQSSRVWFLAHAWKAVARCPHSVGEKLRPWFSPTDLWTRVGLLLAFLGLLVAIIGLGSGFKALEYGKLSAQIAKDSLDMDKWQGKAAFRAWCQDEQDGGRSLTDDCKEILEAPLPPPPHFTRGFMYNVVRMFQRTRVSPTSMGQSHPDTTFPIMNLLVVACAGLVVRRYRFRLRRGTRMLAHTLRGVRGNAETLPVSHAWPRRTPDCPPENTFLIELPCR